MTTATEGSSGIDREEMLATAHASNPSSNASLRDAQQPSSECRASTAAATTQPSGPGAKSLAGGNDDEEVTVSRSLHVRRDWYSTFATFVAGGVAGAASRTMTAPLDRIKLIVQEGYLVQGPAATKSAATAAAGSSGASQSVLAVKRTHPSLLEVARVIKADGGWTAFWRGNVINCFKAGPEFAIVFSIRRYLSSLYEDCVEREKQRRKHSVARWQEHDARSLAISHREEVERLSMLGADADGGAQSSEGTHGSSSSSSGSSTASSSSVTGSSAGVGSRVETQARTSVADGAAGASASPPLPDWSYLSPAEARERERIISAEASIFTPPFNRLGCLCTIPQFAINCTIGSIAGLGAQSIMYPLEVVKTRVVVSRSNEYRGGVREIIRLGYQQGGILEFYRGFAPNMVGIIVYRGLEMGLYSSAQQSIMLYRMQVLKMNRHDASLNSAEVGLVGMFASTVAQTVSYPLNVIRTRLQTQGTNGRAKKYNGMVDCCIKMIRNKGVTSLFSGLTANYLKAVPASAVTFVVFEWVQRLLVGDD